MSKLIKYNEIPVLLYYSNKSISEEELIKSANIETRGSGEGKNYNQVEQEAQIYLIRDAMGKKPNLKLKKIVGIKQEIDSNPEEGIVKIVLNGIAIFK